MQTLRELLLQERSEGLTFASHAPTTIIIFHVPSDVRLTFSNQALASLSSVESKASSVITSIASQISNSAGTPEVSSTHIYGGIIANETRDCDGFACERKECHWKACMV